MGEGWWWLVLLGAVNSTVSVYYYLVVVKHAYLLEPPEERPVAITTVDRVLCYGLSAATVVLGVYPTPLYDWARAAVTNLP